MNQKQVWNKIAKPWQEFRTRPLPEVIEFLKNKKGKLLDLGCGSGRHFIKQKNLEIYGLDFSEKMIELAKKDSEDKKLDVKLKLIEDEKIPYKDNFFDLIICIAVLHCIETKAKRNKLIKELYRTLKPSSQALISVWGRNQKRIKNKPKQGYIPWTIGQEKYQRATYIYDKEELEQELKQAGFKIIKSEGKKAICVVVRK